MSASYMLKKDLSATNEIALGKKNSDDRRETKNNDSANNIIYLGTRSSFEEKVSEYMTKQVLSDLNSKYEDQKKKNSNGKGAMQPGTGIFVKHNVDLNFLKIHVPFINSYLAQFKDLYKHPNFRESEVLNKLHEYKDVADQLSFFSDIVFISDSSGGKPYFKWFRDIRDGEVKEKEKFEFLKEFFIPKQTMWNFQIESFDENGLTVTWKMTYSDIIYSCLTGKKITEEAKEFLIEKALFKMFDIDNKEDIETVKDAIVKVRINQSKFRKDLLKSLRNKCLFTDIGNPKLLLAGHIKPWGKSTNKQRLDINNGILLTPTFDKLFDKFQISFDATGMVMFSENIDLSDWVNLFPTFEEIKNVKIDINKTNKEYLEYHRNKFNANLK